MSRASAPQIKICGVCDPVDASYAVAAGASHVGMIRVPGSRRTRPLALAREVAAAAAGARRVGVFADAADAVITEEAESLGLEVIQLHGAEAPERVQALAGRGRAIWKVVKPRSAADLLAAAARYRSADLLLVEGWSPRGEGGMGARFPWDEVESAVEELPEGTVLGVAGGLTPDNVAEAVRRFRPALVDVSSGVETAPGHKDPGLVRAFVEAVRG